VPDSLNDLVLDAFGTDAGEAMSVLMTYDDGAAGPGPDRVRRAVLKLSEGDLGRLRHYAGEARKDFRDVLYWAEYPPDPDAPKTPAELRARIGMPPDPDSPATFEEVQGRQGHWAPDPFGAAKWRWHDGNRWTDQVTD
jgi:hypothetical protein